MAEKPTLLDAATAFLARSKSWMATVLACIVFVPLIAYLHLRYFFSRTSARKVPIQRVSARQPIFHASPRSHHS